YRIHASYRGLEIAIPTEVRVSNLPEMTVTRPSLTMAAALPITPSVVLNGVIEQPKSSHYFRFNAKAGERYLFRAESMKLGYPLDATINLLDSEGKSVAYEDDPGMDDRSDEYQLDPDLSYSVEKSGTYYVAIRDGMYRGGDQLVYRLTVEQIEPDFLVELREPVKSLYGGQAGTILVRLRRRAGWNAPIEVWAEDLPSGVAVEHQTAEPKDSVVKDTCGVDRVIDGTLVFLPVRADASAAGHFPFRIKARGTMGGKIVEHEASVHYFHQAAGYVYGAMEFQRADLTVNPAPEVVLASAGKVSVSPGADKKLEISLLRPDAGNAGPLQIRAGRLPSGITAEAVAVPAGAAKVTLTIKASPEAVSGPMAVQAVDAAGKPAGESAPFLVEVKPAPQAKE
ncbi:MAG: PPC domain-containing protein, partial [Bryobacteraceae bacterium]